MTPKEILEQRGIYEEALLAGWIEAKGYWEYPILDLDGEFIVKRGKSYPNIEQAKHIWIPSKPDNPQSDYYVPKGTVEAIRDAGGVAYLANGEASVIAMKAAGIHNVFATCHGETTIPKTFLSELELLGISKLINIADKDETGVKGAIKLRDTLLNSLVEYEALQWPDYLPEKADFNDLWIHLHFDKEAVAIALEECKPLILPSPEIKRERKAKLEPIEFDKTSLVSALRQELEHGGYLERKVWQGEWQDCHCPYHGDKKVSAGFNLQSGVLNCFGKCGKAYSPIALAERLGVDWKQFYPQREGKKKPSKTDFRRFREVLDSISDEFVEMPEKPIYINTAWIDQDELPLEWVKNFLLLTHSNSATAVYFIRFHRAIRAGLLDGKDMTLKEIMAVLDSPRLSTQSFVDFCLSLNYLWKLPTNHLEEDTDTNAIIKSKKRGRPEIHYALNTHTDSLIITLAERVEPVLIERLSEDLGLAPRSHTMRDAFDLDLNEFKEWATRVNTPKHEYILELVQNRISELLTNTSSISFSDYELEHPQNLRGKLITMALMPYSERTIIDSTGNAVLVPKTGIQLSKAKIALELGCSESSLGKLYEENSIGRKRMYAWHEVKNPNFCDIKKEMREAPYNLDKEVGGVAYTAYMRYWSYGQLKKTELLYENDIFETFKKHNGKIEALFIRVEQPSLLWNMSSDEIEQKRLNAAKEAEKQANSADTDSKEETIQQKPEKAPEKKARKKSFVSNGDRLYTGHNPDFLREQIEKEVQEFSKYVLKGLSLVDVATGVIASSFQSLKEVIVWLNRNGEKSKGKKMKSKRVGVFYIRCELLDKTFVGSSEDIDKSVSKNYADLSNKKHSCVALQAAYNEFGKDSFQWGILEECDNSEMADIFEQWIAKISEEKEWAVFNHV